MSRLEKPRVLLVEDNEATVTLFTALLRRDFAIETAADGMEAIEKLRTALYSAVILDLVMPVHDGFSVLDFLKKTNPPMLRNVLIVSAAVAPRDLDRARSYGICGVVTKPFDVDVLLAAVKQCVADGGTLGNVFCTSTPMILLLADLLRQRLL